jgi:hypothetical protein
MPNTENIPVNINQPLFNLRQAWIIKGCVCAWNTFKHTRYIQPKGGIEDGKFGGIKVFTNETIMEWLSLMDKDLEAYHRKHKTGAKPNSNTPKKQKTVKEKKHELC